MSCYVIVGGGVGGCVAVSVVIVIVIIVIVIVIFIFFNQELYNML